MKKYKYVLAAMSIITYVLVFILFILFMMLLTGGSRMHDEEVLAAIAQGISIIVAMIILEALKIITTAAIKYLEQK